MNLYTLSDLSWNVGFKIPTFLMSLRIWAEPHSAPKASHQARQMYHLAILPLTALAIHFYILHHIVVDCGRPQGTQIKRGLYTIQILARSFVNVHKGYNSEKPLPLQKILHSCSREEIPDMLPVHCESWVLGDRFFPSPVSLDSCQSYKSTVHNTSVTFTSTTFTNKPKTLPI